MTFLRFSFFACLIFAYLANEVFGAVLYVDNTLSENCLGNNYSIQKRNCNGSDGTAYKSVQEALDALVTGDTISIRGGVYKEGHIRIDYKKSGDSWQPGHFNTIMSYPGEWAILDGENGGGTGGPNGLRVGSANSHTGCVLGYSDYPGTGEHHMKYWKFERLEIRNGASADGQYAAGFWGTGGPFIFRYCYIHSNMADVINNNPAGLKGHVWHDSIVEYCYFKDNGAPSTHHNSAHLCIYSDYHPNDIAREGFVDFGHHTMRNNIRYNLFMNGTVAVKYKQDQFFTGRDTDKGEPNDRYKDYGDDVHHNIIINASGLAIDARQDFIQVHHNIIDSSASAIGVGEEDTRSIYKAVVYNNTIINPADWGIFRVHSWWSDYNLESQTPTYFGYDYNNIVAQARDGWNWSDIAVDAYSSFGGKSPDYSGYFNDRNLFYNAKQDYRDPDGTLLVYLGDSSNRLTELMFESRFPGTDLFTIRGSGLFKGETGSAKYKLNNSYKLDNGLTVNDAGITVHPYLTQINLPKYLGAVNPGRDSGMSWDPQIQDGDDAGWVDYVLGLPEILSDTSVIVNVPSVPSGFTTE